MKVDSLRIPVEREPIVATRDQVRVGDILEHGTDRYWIAVERITPAGILSSRTGNADHVWSWRRLRSFYIEARGPYHPRHGAGPLIQGREGTIDIPAELQGKWPLYIAVKGGAAEYRRNQAIGAFLARRLPAGAASIALVAVAMPVNSLTARLDCAVEVEGQLRRFKSRALWLLVYNAFLAAVDEQIRPWTTMRFHLTRAKDGWRYEQEYGFEAATEMGPAHALLEAVAGVHPRSCLEPRDAGTSRFVRLHRSI